MGEFEMTIAYSETENFINSLNEAIDALNKSSSRSFLKPINTTDDLRDGKLLATIIEKFESVCGRKRRIKDKNYYQFIEDWLITIGNMPYIPHYGKFVKHILRECGVDLISNIFGIVAITMYINRHDMWQSFNVEIFFLLLGEPLIPKISKLLNKNLNIESDEKYAAIVQNRQLQKQLDYLNRKYEALIEVLKYKEDIHIKVTTFLNCKLRCSKKRVTDLENQIKSLNQTIKRLNDENTAKLTKFEALRALIDGNDKTLVSNEELLSLKKKVNSMQNEMKVLSNEMELKFSINK